MGKKWKEKSCEKCEFITGASHCRRFPPSVRRGKGFWDSIPKVWGMLEGVKTYMPACAEYQEEGK